MYDNFMFSKRLQFGENLIWQDNLYQCTLSFMFNKFIFPKGDNLALQKVTIWKNLIWQGKIDHLGKI